MLYTKLSLFLLEDLEFSSGIAIVLRQKISDMVADPEIVIRVPPARLSSEIKYPSFA